MPIGPDVLVGDVEHVADAFAAWHEEGATEVMCRLDPPSSGVSEVIVEAARLFRAAASSESPFR